MTPTRRIDPPLSGVDTATLFATLSAVRAHPETAKFQFRITNRWRVGTQTRSTTGHDPTPVVFLLDALTACLTAGMVNVAAARGVALHSVSSTVEGDIDLRGILGLTDDVRDGYQAIRVNFRICGDAPPDVLKDLVEQSGARSAVYDVLSPAVPIRVDVGSD